MQDYEYNKNNLLFFALSEFELTTNIVMMNAERIANVHRLRTVESHLRV